jgi:hypothetical protein
MMEVQMADEWGPWIEHDGKGCPVLGMYCETRWESLFVVQSWEGVVTDRWAPAFVWANHLQETPRGKLWGRVIRYRVRKPRALLDLIEMVERMPERVNA